MPSAPVVAGAPAPLTVTPAAGPLLQVVTNVSWSVTHLCSITLTANGSPAFAPAGAWSSSSAGFGFGNASGAR